MRIKRNRKLMSILLTLSLLVTLLVPMVGPAAASSTYTMSNVRTLGPSQLGAYQTLGTLEVDVPTVSVNSYVYLSLPVSPSGYAIDKVAISLPTNVNGNANGISAVTTTQTGNIVKIATTANALASGNPGRFIVGSSATAPGTTNPADFAGLYVSIPTGVSGEVDATMSAPSSQLFTSGTVAIAKVGTGTVLLSTENSPSIGSGGGQVAIIDVKESNAGALVASTDSVKLTLPPGFTWRHNAAINTAYWGSTADMGFSYGNADRDLMITMAHDGPGLFVNLNAYIDIDESVAKQGDIVVNVGGDSTSSVGTITVGSYGDYGVTVKANGDPASITAGKSAVKTGKFEIDENLAGSLISNRTVTLSLPSGVAWNQGPTIDTGASTLDIVNSLNSGSWAHVGTDGRTIKATITTAGNAPTANKATLVFKDAEVTPAVDFSGDVVVTFGGSEGLTGTLTLAKVAAGVTASAASTPDVKIGLSGQTIGDVTITEAASGNIDGTPTYSALDQDTGDANIYLAEDVVGSGSANIVLKAPSGVTFTNVPTVTVTSGDVQLNTGAITTDTTGQNEGILTIPVKSSSTQASTIKISGIQLTIDRTVPEGPINLKVQGSAVDETTFSVGGVISSTDATLFPNDSTAVSVPVATVVTPAPGQTKATAVFKIGDTSFTLNGVKTTMDAAPYLKNDRTYLPLRFVAQAVGVSDSNIIWNADEQSVTLIKDGSVVKLTIGSTTMTINGTPITMDTAPEIVDPGRTMLPVRWVMQALGANIQWDPATQTVTVN